jgi:cysteine desulfurase
MRGSDRLVYLDHAATTPCDRRVADAMADAYREQLGNPHALHHAPGRRAAALVAEARERIARAVGADPDEVVFTSGATESNNLAIRGAAGATRGALTTCRTEHASVLRPCERLAAEGWQVDHVPPDRWGRLDLVDIAAAFRPETRLVSLMWVNNELGTIHDVAAIGRLVRARDAVLHVDAAQAIGRVPIDTRACDIDLLTLSGHKIYGPHGIGALIVGRRARARGLSPLVLGGGQQDGLRGGTVDVVGALGLGLACELARVDLASTTNAATALTARIRSWIGELAGARCLSPPDAVPGVVCVAFDGIDASDLLACLEGVAISAHAACHDDPTRTSHVLDAIGVTRDVAASAVRISIGRSTTRDELDRGLAELADTIAFLRTLTTAKGDRPWTSNDSRSNTTGRTTAARWSAKS